MLRRIANTAIVEIVAIVLAIGAGYALARAIHPSANLGTALACAAPFALFPAGSILFGELKSQRKRKVGVLDTKYEIQALEWINELRLPPIKLLLVNRKNWNGYWSKSLQKLEIRFNDLWWQKIDEPVRQLFLARALCDLAQDYRKVGLTYLLLESPIFATSFIGAFGIWFIVPTQIIVGTVWFYCLSRRIKQDVFEQDAKALQLTQDAKTAFLWTKKYNEHAPMIRTNIRLAKLADAAEGMPGVEITRRPLSDGE